MERHSIFWAVSFIGTLFVAVLMLTLGLFLWNMGGLWLLPSVILSCAGTVLGALSLNPLLAIRQGIKKDREILAQQERAEEEFLLPPRERIHVVA